MDGANDLLSRRGTPGLYIARKGNAVSAYLLGNTSHYMIFVEGEEIFLQKYHPRFRQLVEMVIYYHTHNLANVMQKLRDHLISPNLHKKLETSSLIKLHWLHLCNLFTHSTYFLIVVKAI